VIWPERLAGDRVTIRLWREGDDEAVGTSPRESTTGRFFGRSLNPRREEPDPDAPTYTICREGRPVGRLWFKPWARPYEVGYLVRTDEWGKGIATAALQLISDWLIEDAGVEKVMLFTHPDNIGSQRVAENARFTRDGIEAGYAQFKDGKTDAIRFVRVSGG
jgi:RimJ/RimL family protein N-acetyltransferase